MEYGSGTARGQRYGQDMHRGRVSRPGGVSAGSASVPAPSVPVPPSRAGVTSRPGPAQAGDRGSGTYRAGAAPSGTRPGRTYGSAGAAGRPDERHQGGPGARGSSRGGGGRGGGPGGPPSPGKGKGRGGRGPRRRRPIWSWFLVVSGALLMLISGGTVAGYEYVMDQVNKAIPQQDLIGSAKGDRTNVTIDGAKNILLVGIDPRKNQSASDPPRSDSIIILHIPATHDRAFLISIPRDSYVQIPEYDNGAYHYNGGQNKINAAFAYGATKLTGTDARKHGFELLSLTIKSNFGITPDAGAIIDFNGFKSLVEYLGGVRMYVDEKVTSIHIGFDKDGNKKKPFIEDPDTLGLTPIPGVKPQVYEKGWHDFTPWQALDYVRQRHLMGDNDGDYGRQRHQQQFVKAIAKAVLKRGMTSPTQLPSLLKALGKAMIIDTGGISLEDWVFAMKGISTNDLLTIKTNDGHFNSKSIPGIGSVELINDTSEKLFRAVVNDTVDAFIAQHPDWISQDKQDG